MLVIISHWLFYSELFRALAKNCGAPLNDKEGAQAKNWKEGKAVRVVCKRLWEVWFLKKLCQCGSKTKKTRHQTNWEITAALRRSDVGRAKRVSGFMIGFNVSYGPFIIHIYLYNNPSYSHILIGSRQWSIRGQTHRWRQRSIQVFLNFEFEPITILCKCSEKFGVK